MLKSEKLATALECENKPAAIREVLTAIAKQSGTSLNPTHLAFNAELKDAKSSLAPAGFDMAATLPALKTLGFDVKGKWEKYDEPKVDSGKGLNR